MKRRQLLAGLGAAAAGSAAIGTGAFTSATANRSVSVSVADENKAYLALSPAGDDDENSTFVSQDNTANNELSVDINDATGTQDNGDGVGLDSVYTFDSVFQVENQGTQEVDVSIGTLEDEDFDPDASGLTVEFYDGTDSSTSLDSSTGTPVTLGTGTSVDIGMKIETDEPNLDDFDADATVSSTATGGGGGT